MTVSRITISDGGPTFSRIAQGFGSAVRWQKNPHEILEHVSECIDLGVTTLDIAAVYGGGQAETLLGDALALKPALRDKVQLVTKCSIGIWDTSQSYYDTSKAHILWSVDQSLRKLKTDRVDVLLIHRPDPLMDADEVASAFSTLRQSGKVLFFGVSNFTPSQFELLASRLSFPLVTNEVQFSVMHLDSWYDGTLDLCQKLRISPMAWGPLGGGRLFKGDTEQGVRLREELGQIGKDLGATMDQVALAWLLKHPAGIVPILGTGKADRIRNAVQAEGISLSREQWFKIWVASTGNPLP
ncbi:MAG: aldo/keto reductase [Anaerolineae bacterium]|nr:aldo/keto reductase [Anaerolineae bacterium]